MDSVDRIRAAALELLAALDDFDTHDPDALGQVAVELVAVVDRVGAHHAIVCQRAEHAGTHTLDDATSLTSWLAHRSDTARSRCSTLVATGRFLAEYPVLGQAARAGELTAAHVTRVRSAARTVACRTALADPATQTDVVAWAALHPFPDWERVARHWTTVVDPDGTEDAAAHAHEDRRFTLHPRFGGAGYDGEVLLGNLEGAEVREGVARLADEFFADDLATARDRLGREPLPSELGRSHAQRWADALVELVRRGIAASPSITVTLPTVNVLIDADTLAAGLSWLAGDDDAFAELDPEHMVCEHLDGSPVTPTEAIATAMTGHIRRVVMGARSEIVDFGRRKRLFTGAAREAAIVAFRWCEVPGCRRPARHCQIDHHHPWFADGLTDLRNARLRCGHHNRSKHRDDVRRWAPQVA